MKYFEEIKRSMNYLSTKNDVVFLGQAVNVPGTAMRNTLVDVREDKLIELPVAEEMQMGMAIGMSLTGIVPICIYPRWNFLLLAINQLVNHLDKLKEISDGKIHSKVIIRTAIGSIRPLDPQAQHTGDFTSSINSMCKNINVINISQTEDIYEAYNLAYNRKDNISSLIVETADFYNEK